METRSPECSRSVFRMLEPQALESGMTWTLYTRRLGWTWNLEALSEILYLVVYSIL